MNLLRFPLALYLRLFGAAGLGYILGGVGKEPTFVALGVVCFAIGATLAGWLMMRPLMREAKAAVKDAGKAPHNPEEKANDTRH